MARLEQPGSPPRISRLLIERRALIGLKGKLGVNVRAERFEFYSLLTTINGYPAEK